MSRTPTDSSRTLLTLPVFEIDVVFLFDGGVIQIAAADGAAEEAGIADEGGLIRDLADAFFAFEFVCYLFYGVVF